MHELGHRLRPAAGPPAGALVLLHGRGADEHDLFDLLDLLDPDRRLVGVTPRAPLALPPGGAHWYVTRRVGYPDVESFHAGYEQAAGWLDALPEVLGFPRERIVLGGFSQGAVMAYALGLGAGRPPPAAIIALSGFMPQVERFELDLGARHGLRVAVGHGVYDPVIPVDFARQARTRLEAAGVALTYRESPIDHTIDPAFLRELTGWIRDAVDAVEPRAA